jgi:hypothetical protein
MATTSATIGFVGLGHMGGNMAARILTAGYPVYGEERSREHAQHLIDEGLKWCDTPREVAEAADVVFTSVPDDGALEDVASGPNGVLAGLAAGKTWVDVSTVSPQASRELAARVRTQGAFMLDAPVSGSVPQVQSGTLTIMVGGDEDVPTCTIFTNGKRTKRRSSCCLKVTACAKKPTTRRCRWMSSTPLPPATKSPCRRRRGGSSRRRNRSARWRSPFVCAVAAT